MRAASSKKTSPKWYQCSLLVSKPVAFLCAFFWGKRIDDKERISVQKKDFKSSSIIGILHHH